MHLVCVGIESVLNLFPRPRSAKSTHLVGLQDGGGCGCSFGSGPHSPRQSSCCASQVGASFPQHQGREAVFSTGRVANNAWLYGL